MSTARAAPATGADERGAYAAVPVFPVLVLLGHLVGAVTGRPVPVRRSRG